MKLPTWIKKRDATIEELREQLTAAEKAHGDAERAVISAELLFDEEGSPATEKALTSARDLERSTGEHLARARRLLEGATARAAEERLAAIRKERDERVVRVSDDSERERLFDRLVAAWRSVAEADAAYVAHQVERGRELDAIGKLDRELSEIVRREPFRVEPLRFEIAARLEESLRNIPYDDRRQVVVRSLMEILDPHNIRNGAMFGTSPTGIAEDPPSAA